MDGKVLVICDEMPGVYEEYSVKDSKYLISPDVNFYEEESIIYTSWDSIIPEDRSFIVACKKYARFEEKPPADFVFKKRGAIDPGGGTIRDSIQEESYLKEYRQNVDWLERLHNEGKDWQEEALELASQYSVAATQRFFEDFSQILSMNGIVSIIPCFSENSDTKTIEYRKAMLSSWRNADGYMKRRSSVVRLNDFSTYSDFRDIFKKACDEALTIIGMPYFFEEDEDDDALGL